VLAVLSQPQRQSAAIPYRLQADHIEVLLVTSRTHKRWVLPKGKVPRGMPAHASAAREAREEGGVIGDVDHTAVGAYPVPVVREGQIAGEVSVPAFPLHVSLELDVWPEMHLRQRQWLAIERALKLVKDKGIRTVLRAFKHSLAI